MQQHHRTAAPLFQVVQYGDLSCGNEVDVSDHSKHEAGSHSSKDSESSKDDRHHHHHHHHHEKDKSEDRDGAKAEAASAAAAAPAAAAAAVVKLPAPGSAPEAAPDAAAAAAAAAAAIDMPGMPAKLGPAGAPPLNLLANLPGEWHGKGFNLIFLPVFFPAGTQPKPKAVDRFRVMVNNTHEILEFTPIPGAIPNRGDTQKDIDLFGMTYMQRINDAENQESLHKEPGIFLVVPPTSVPKAGATVVRQGCVPHGNSFHAVGHAKSYAGPPTIPDASITPIVVPALGAPILSDISKIQPSYMAPIHKARDDNPGMPVMNPNSLLRNTIKGQTILETVEIHVSTDNPGFHPLKKDTVTNIPFLQKHAEVVKVESTFYLETVKRADGSIYLQLQYTQLVMLRFQELDWPHVSVATLIKT